LSKEAMSAVLHHSKASPHAKLVLMAIAYHENETGAWMSQATLARLCNMSERTVRRHVAELRDLYEIDILPGEGAGSGARMTNRYFIILDCPEACDRSFTHKETSAEVIALTASRREQYRSKQVAIEVNSGRNTGQKWSQYRSVVSSK
jgi:predicted DNA-binding transcriptional regulator YafY